MLRSIYNAWLDLTRDERRALLAILALLVTGLAARALWYGADRPDPVALEEKD